MNLIDDATLLKMAEAEILQDAKKAAIRHSIAGISGWQPCPKPNKVFLTNTILQTVLSNRTISLKGKKTEKRKNSKRKLIKKDEKMNIIYQVSKKKEKQVSGNSNKNENEVKSESPCFAKLNKKSNREDRKLKS